MHPSIRKRLSSAEEDILLALSGESGDINGFEKTWSTLRHELECTALINDTPSDTTSLAHAVASRVALIASCFLDLEQADMELKGKLRGDFDVILGNLKDVSLSSSPQETPARDHTSAHHSHISPHDSFPRSFVAETYSWLLDNIANPYPSAGFKESVARRHNCSISSVNAWFISARRRMGWTALCREHFQNCRADAIDAAYRALVKEDPNRKLPVELVQAFVTVKSNAEALYSTFTRSPLAGDLDEVVKDMTDDDKSDLEKERWKTIEKEREHKASKKTSSRAYRTDYDASRKPLGTDFSYPTPRHSPSTSPVPALEESLTDESEDEEEISPPRLAGHKRKCSYVEPDTFSYDDSGSATRRAKRSRSANCVTNGPYHIIPSPPPSPNRLLSLSDLRPHGEAPQVTSTSSQLQLSRPRKRRLSDSTLHGSLRRPVGTVPGPRMHAVSDPLFRPPCLVDLDVDDWFNATFAGCFDVPPPIDSSEIDTSALLEVELFENYSIPPPLSRSSTQDVSSLYSSGDPQITLDCSALSTTYNNFSSSAESLWPDNLAERAGTQCVLPIFAEVCDMIPLSIPDRTTSGDWADLIADGPFRMSPDIHTIGTADPTRHGNAPQSPPYVDPIVA